jgi:REP-associated tyrosine transposase
MSPIMTYTRRHLPHSDPSGQDIFITWCLHDSLPAKFRPTASIESSGKAFVMYDRILDQARTGPLWLKDPRISYSVLSALDAARQRKMFALRAYVLMANHVHVLLAPQSPIAQITQQIKGATAREANLILGHTGSRFWQNESFDHWIRNPEEWQRVRAYIERNPVAAGLVCKPEDWPWSSASRRIE